MELRRNITAVDGGVLMEEIDGECKDGAGKEHYYNAGVEVLEVMDAECGVGAGKEHSSGR